LVFYLIPKCSGLPMLHKQLKSQTLAYMPL
jgi:hypothetical protein